MRTLVAEPQERLGVARQGGGERYVRRHRRAGEAPGARAHRPAHGSRLAVSRALPTRCARPCTTTTRRAPASSIRALSMCRFCREVVVVANDATVKGGTYNTRSPSRSTCAPAQQNHAARQPFCRASIPVDSGGAFLPDAGGRRSPDRDHFVAASSSIRRGCRRRGFLRVDRGRDGVVHGRRRSTSRRCPDETWVHQVEGHREPSFSAAPACESGDRRVSRGGSGRSRRPHPHFRCGGPFRPERRARTRHLPHDCLDAHASRRSPRCVSDSAIAPELPKYDPAEQSTALSAPTAGRPTTCGKSWRGSWTDRASTNSSSAMGRRLSPASRTFKECSSASSPATACCSPNRR